MRAILKSSADARICTPIRVRWRKNPSPVRRTMVTATVTMSSFGTEMEPIWYDSESQAERCVPFGAEPSIRIARFWRP
jgi:hypothetical protein